MEWCGRRLIINADDFGYSSERDQGIIECFRKSAISSASLMVNGVDVVQAVELAKKENLPLGLHLNLTEGIPIGGGDKYHTLVTQEGVFRGKFGLREKLKADMVDLAEIRQEIVCQIERFHDLVGCLPFHVDGHQHIHIYPGVCEVFAEILQDKGVRVTRLPTERCLDACDWIDSSRLTFYQEVIQQCQECQDIFVKHKLRFAPAFVGLSTCGKDMSVERLRTALDAAFMDDNSASVAVNRFDPEDVTKDTSMPRNPVSVCELMVHPGYPTGNAGGCGTGPDEFSKSAERKYEMDILLSASFKAYLEEKAMAVCSFTDTF